jgi:hypothetical protein
MPQVNFKILRLYANTRLLFLNLLCVFYVPLQEVVTVVGFPQGGDNICVTKGVVSRLDIQRYTHGAGQLLTVQTDSAINSVRHLLVENEKEEGRNKKKVKNEKYTHGSFFLP